MWFAESHGAYCCDRDIRIGTERDSCWLISRGLRVALDYPSEVGLADTLRLMRLRVSCRWSTASQANRTRCSRLPSPHRQPENARAREVFDAPIPRRMVSGLRPSETASNRERTRPGAKSPNRSDFAGLLANPPRRSKRAACKPNDPAVRRGRKETPRLGLEPRTYRLTAGRSTIELSRKLSVVGQGVRGHLAGDKARRLALSVKPGGRSTRRSEPRKCPQGPDWAGRTGPTRG